MQNSKSWMVGLAGLAPNSNVCYDFTRKVGLVGLMEKNEIFAGARSERSAPGPEC